MLHLEADTQGPDVFRLERCLLTNDLALVPWLAMTLIGDPFITDSRPVEGQKVCSRDRTSASHEVSLDQYSKLPIVSQDSISESNKTAFAWTTGLNMYPGTTCA